MEKKDLQTDKPQMVRISTEKCESLNFYKYLCQKIGSEEAVRVRRLAFCISDISQSRQDKISSGSKGEGLDIKGSDLDIMYIDTAFKVYESATQVIWDGRTVPLIMNTEETQPCFTQLQFLFNIEAYPSQLVKCFHHMLQTNHLGCMLSSEQYKMFYLSFCTGRMAKIMKLHGPCISDTFDQVDLASCLKCDQWIFQVQPWVSRPRTTWPPPEIISKIISFGVLFVPIGCKGSVNENLEWRISFSVAEKFLIYSFRHTQFLCYAMLKVFLKEIIEKHEDLKGLLCSYFLKTLMFWIAEETDPNLWRPDNIIPCFMACLQRLMYCVRYSILSHYFIPDNNLFYTRFSVKNKIKLETILKNVYDQGINCFAISETLKDYQRQFYKISKSFMGVDVIRIIQHSSDLCDHANVMKIHLLYHCLHHCRTGLSKGLFALYLSKACWFAPYASKYLVYSSENKQQYCKYKYDLSHLLIGVHSDAVSGWLTLASFLYSHKKYFASLSVINYALQKYTDEKMFTGLPLFEATLLLKHKLNLMKKEYTFIQKHELNLMKKETLYTVLKALTIQILTFNRGSSILPQELQHLEDDYNSCNVYHPLPFAYFLLFLCYYHLHDFRACRHYLQQLTSQTTNFSIFEMYPIFSTPIMSGIAHQLMGGTDAARQIFQVVDEVYKISI